jgi:hypothetical protein
MTAGFAPLSPGCPQPAVWVAWFIDCDPRCPGHPSCDEHSSEATSREPIGGGRADPLVAFWTARLDEDEAAALATVIPRAAGDGMTDDTAALNGTPNSGRLAWKTSHERDEEGTPVHWVISDPDPSAVAHAMGLERGTGGAVAEHIARHDPARALREVEADRRLIALHRPEWTDYVDGDGIERTSRCPSLECGECEPGGSPDNWPCPTVRARIAIWDAHPDYRPEWKP